MDDDIIEVRLYDKNHIKMIQLKAMVNDKKSLKEMIKTLNHKGINLKLEKRDTDFF